MGRLPARLVALFKSRDCSQDTVWWLAGVHMLSPVNPGRPSDIHSLVMVLLREDTPEFTLVDIGKILGLAHLVPEGGRLWVVNSDIDLRMFNKIYWLYQWGYDG